jgi:hypothetical protein
MIRCLFNGPKELEDAQGGSSIRGGFRVMPMRFMLQRYSHLEETHPAKISITDIRWTPHHAVEISWQVGIVESANKTKKTKIWTPTSNLTWLQAAIRKFNSRTDMSEILPGAQYNSYKILFPLSNGYLHALIQSTVSELCNFEVSWTAGILGWSDLSNLRVLNFWVQSKHNLRKLPVSNS